MTQKILFMMKMTQYSQAMTRFLIGFRQPLLLRSSATTLHSITRRIAFSSTSQAQFRTADLIRENVNGLWDDLNEKQWRIVDQLEKIAGWTPEQIHAHYWDLREREMIAAMAIARNRFPNQIPVEYERSRAPRADIQEAQEATMFSEEPVNKTVGGSGSKGKNKKMTEDMAPI